MSNAPWGGSEELWVRSATYAIEQRHDVVISVYDWGALNPKIAKLMTKGAKINKRKRVFFGSSIAKRIKGFLIKKLFSEREILSLKRYSPDVIVVSQGTIFECMTDAFIQLEENTKAKLIVITQANSEYDTIPDGFFEQGRKLFKMAHHLYFVSDRNRVVAERQLAMRLPNSSVISNPANIDKYGIVDWNDTATLMMACVGRLDSTVKGIGVLLQILGRKEWEQREWILNLYGTGKDEQYLKELILLYKLEEKVFFNGFVENVNEVWEKNHVLLMPSTLEGTPLSLIEAMLSGRSAVVSDVGGNAELIIEGVSGFVAEAPSLLSFGNAMERMWKNSRLLSAFGKNAYEAVNERINLLSFKQIIDDL